MVEKYSGTANPETWLSDYVSACDIYEGSANSAVRFFAPDVNRDGTYVDRRPAGKDSSYLE